MKTTSKKVVSKKVVKEKRLGRPPVFTPSLKRTIGKFLRQHGLTYGVKAALEEAGVSVSIATAGKIARELGIKFKVGRPPVSE